MNPIEINMKRFFVELIGKPMRLAVKKFMLDRCDFCLGVIPEDEEGAFFFTWDRNDDKPNIGQACPECGKFLVANDRENLIRIFKDALRREFPVVPQRGLFEQEALENMNHVLDSVQDYGLAKGGEPINL